MGNYGGSLKIVFMAFVVAIILLMLANIAGFFFYATYDFTAQVDSIDFFGTDRVVIHFNDGSVYNLYELPEGLREGRTYHMQYQKPYVFGNERLVVTKEID